MVAGRDLPRSLLDNAFHLVIWQRRKDRKTAGADFQWVTVPGLQRMGADGERALLPMQADRVQVAPDGQ